MTIILTIIATIACITLVPTMAIIMVYELTPLDKTPAWVEKSYNKIVKVLDKLFA
jgi:hypothetical protein